MWVVDFEELAHSDIEVLFFCLILPFTSDFSPPQSSEN